MVSKPSKFPAPAFRRAEVAVSWKDQLDLFILYLERQITGDLVALHR